MRYTLAVCLAVSLFVSCKPAQTVSFCEGVSPEGKGVSCGPRFTTGEVTMLVSLKKRFEIDALGVKIHERQEMKEKLVDSFTFSVDPEKQSATTNLSFYNEGTYRVTVTGKENAVLGEAEIEVIDTY
ncbi:MAG: hypothetical protein KBA15_04395 [Spirochaetes bacterium]|jgi:hypothetical protein|nr:hypothetical protein [Spirochaetota bacterium]